MRKAVSMFLALCVILSLGVFGGTAALATDDGLVQGSSGTFTVEEAVERIRAYQECQNLAGAHEYYHTELDHQGELDNIWVNEEEYMETMSWTNNTQFMYGYDAVWDFYCGDSLTGHGEAVQQQSMGLDEQGIITMDEEWYATGTLWYHMLMSPVIEVAGDGQTAVGLWQSFGTVTEGTMCQWTCEDYTMVFVKQSDGEWRIWHLRTFVHFYTTYGYTWYEQNMAVSGTGGTEQPAGVGVLASGEATDEVVDTSEPGTYTGTYYIGLSLYRVPVLATIPEPYETWTDIEDTFAWGGTALLGNNEGHSTT